MRPIVVFSSTIGYTTQMGFEQKKAGSSLILQDIQSSSGLLYAPKLNGGVHPLWRNLQAESQARNAYSNFVRPEVKLNRADILLEKRERLLTTLLLLKEYTGPVGTLLYPAGFGDGVVSLLADHTVILDKAEALPKGIQLPDSIHSLRELFSNPEYQVHMEEIIGLARKEGVQMVEQYGANSLEKFTKGYYFMTDVKKTYAIPTLIASLFVIGGNFDTIRIQQTGQEFIITSDTIDGEKKLTYKQCALPSRSASLTQSQRTEKVKNILQNIPLTDPVFVLSKGDNADVSVNFSEFDFTFLADYPHLGQYLENSHIFSVIPLPKGQRFSRFGYSGMEETLAYVGRKK